VNRHDVLALLEAVRAGALAPQSALERLSTMPYEDTGFARIDHHRGLRLGIPEVIYAEGKSPEQVAEIFARTAAAFLALALVSLIARRRRRIMAGRADEAYQPRRQPRTAG